MKRTAHARLVAVGTVDAPPPVVEKHATWGAAFAEDTVQRELAGIPSGTSCDLCGVALGDYWAARRQHNATKYHQRNALAANPESDE